MEDNIIERTADKLIANVYNGNVELRYENVDKIESVLNKNSHPHNFSFYADQAKTISFSISQKEHIINKLACAVDELHVDSGLTDDNQTLVSLVPIDELNGFLGYMYYIYCNWQSDNRITSLITINVKDYDKGSKDFTAQLLKLLCERTENEKKVTNNG